MWLDLDKGQVRTGNRGRAAIAAVSAFRHRHRRDRYRYSEQCSALHIRSANDQKDETVSSLLWGFQYVTSAQREEGDQTIIQGSVQTVGTSC